MADFFDSLREEHRKFIEEQHVFFVATAPREGRLSLSPKGMDTLRVVDDRTVAYLDMSGSGAETAAHLRENSRITLMLCSFGKKPLILRLYGRGRVILPGESDWDQFLAHFTPIHGQRQIIVLEIESLQTSCGFGVPVFEFVAERDTLRKWMEKKDEEGLREYREEKNKTSIDGLPTGL